ncbi:MAG TPA: glycoside hydrolase family 43 protein, partial [Lachnospiraceae bacterium]|nr:glycoside hydrolase family 43 protein [Lachnospiraceae bacterium]
MGRRQRKENFDISFSMEFTPHNKEAAGLIIMQACNHQFRIEKVLEDGKTVLQLIRLTTKQEGLPFLPG